MKLENTNPPNIEAIRAVLNPPPNTFYCYGDTVYNPSAAQVPPDIIFHEEIHSKQQQQFSTPELWWYKYLNDPTFRQHEEVEAYAHQYNYIKKFATNKDLKQALYEMAANLTQHYKLELSHQDAENLIRQTSKSL